MIKNSFIVGTILAAAPLSAVVITDTGIQLMSPGSFGDYSIFVPLSFSGGPSGGGSFLVEFDNTIGAEFSITNYTLGNEFRMYLSSPNTEFSVADVQSSSDFFGNSVALDAANEFEIPLGESLYLSYWVDLESSGPDRLDQFGWIQLTNVGASPTGNLELTDSAVSLSDGIIVGTDQVPEPSSAVLLAFASLALLRHRKR